MPLDIVADILRTHADERPDDVSLVFDDRQVSRAETVKAVVVLQPAARLDAGDVIAYSRQRLARFKCPTSVDYTDALPRNPSGNVLKKDLRAAYWAGHPRQVN